MISIIFLRVVALERFESDLWGFEEKSAISEWFTFPESSGGHNETTELSILETKPWICPPWNLVGPKPLHRPRTTPPTALEYIPGLNRYQLPNH